MIKRLVSFLAGICRKPNLNVDFEFFPGKSFVTGRNFDLDAKIKKGKIKRYEFDDGSMGYVVTYRFDSKYSDTPLVSHQLDKNGISPYREILYVKTIPSIEGFDLDYAQIKQSTFCVGSKIRFIDLEGDFLCCDSDAIGIGLYIRYNIPTEELRSFLVDLYFKPRNWS